MKKFLILSILVLFLGSLMALESGPSETVGFIKFTGLSGLNFVSVAMDAGYATSTDLVTPIANCNQASYWDEIGQGWVTVNKSPFGTWPSSFAVTPGMAVMIKLTAPEDVYVAGNLFTPEISFDLAMDLNAISIPLSRSDLTTSSLLGADMVDINQISNWDAVGQGWVTVNKSPFGTWPSSFATDIGMALMVKATATFTWPTPPVASGNPAISKRSAVTKRNVITEKNVIRRNKK